MDKIESNKCNSSSKRLQMKKTSEQLAAHSLAMTLDEWVIYDPSNGESLEEWLETNRPSKLSREDHVGWIMVTCRSESETDETSGSAPDYDGLLNAWEDLTTSQDPITYEKICSLALEYNETNGMWLFHVKPGYKVDLLWKIVATNVINGRLGKLVSSAKVSPFDPSEEEYKHVIIIFHDNFTNHEEVLEVEKEIRKAGIKCSLMYKPIIYTVCGVYANNPWELRPTIYLSKYNALTHSSEIKYYLPHKKFDHSMEIPNS